MQIKNVIIKNISYFSKIVAMLFITLTIFLFTGCGPQHRGAKFFDTNVLSDDIRSGIYVMTEKSYNDYAKGKTESLSPLIATVKNDAIIIRDSFDEIIYESDQLDRFDKDKYFRAQSQLVKIWLDCSFAGDILTVRRFSYSFTQDFQFVFDSEIE